MILQQNFSLDSSLAKMLLVPLSVAKSDPNPSVGFLFFSALKTGISAAVLRSLNSERGGGDTMSYRASFGKKNILVFENDQNGLKTP